MNIEEKAKAYDEAVNEIKGLRDMLLKEGVINENGIIYDNFNRIFPELKENEDERIGKELIEYFRWNVKQILNDFSNKECIDWLEKQGEQKPTNTVEPRFKINDKVIHKETGKTWTIHWYLADTNSYYVIDEEGLINHYSEDVLESAEQKPIDKVEPKFKVGDCIKPIDSCLGSQRTICEVCDGWYVTNQGTLDFEYENNWELVEQKPAWSEEDKEMIQDIINDIAIAQEQVYCKSRCEDEINWLKSLKDRVQPQPKKEWSEEDRLHYMNVLEALEYVKGCKSDYDKIEAAKSDIAWFKFLKDGVLPQPKPEWSEEDEYNTAFIIETLLGLDGDKEYLAKCKKMANWLKSLRPQNWTKEDKERYISCLQRLSTGNPEQPETINSKWFKEHVYPQKQWKPSDEQMDALEDAIADAVSSIQKHSLESLYNELKKLF